MACIEKKSLRWTIEVASLKMYVERKELPRRRVLGRDSENGWRVLWKAKGVVRVSWAQNALKVREAKSCLS